jgi:hypothetical protein
MPDKVLWTAHATEHGVQAICPTTYETYLAVDTRPASFSGHQAIACACPCCDAHRRTGKDYDPRERQWHLYILESAV